MKKLFLICAAFVACAHTPSAQTLATNNSDRAYIRFDAEVTGDTVEAFEKALDAANQLGVAGVIVEINTPGGEIPAGQEMSKAIERSKTPVVCVVDGMAASMGLYILQSCDLRIMTARSLLMGHEPATAVRGQPDDAAETAELLSKLSHAMAFHITSRMKISVAEYEKRIAHGRMWWITSDEALSIGAIDGVITNMKSLNP